MSKSSLIRKKYIPENVLFIVNKGNVCGNNRYFDVTLKSARGTRCVGLPDDKFQHLKKARGPDAWPNRWRVELMIYPLWARSGSSSNLDLDHRPQFERFLKDFFDEYERHLAENFHAFCVIL